MKELIYNLQIDNAINDILYKAKRCGIYSEVIATADEMLKRKTKISRLNAYIVAFAIAKPLPVLI